MRPEDQHMDVLQNLESAVMDIWRNHPEMSDYAVLRAYEAAIAHYSALARGTAPKPEGLTGLDAEVFQGVQGICEWRLGHRALEGDDEAATSVTPMPVADLVACLKKLRKSVDRWNRSGGRQGYLQLVSQYVQ
jgi:hypothetical protein